MSSVVTLGVAIAATGGVVYLRGDFRSAPAPASSRVPTEPCATIPQERLDELDARKENMRVASDVSRCRWETEIAGVSGITLNVNYKVPMGQNRAELGRERGQEPVTEVGELYEDMHSAATEASDDWEVSTKEETSQSYGEESTLVYLRETRSDSDISYDSGTVSASLLVRDGNRVTEVRVSDYGAELRSSQTERVLTDLAEDVPWQE